MKQLFHLLTLNKFKDPEPKVLFTPPSENLLRCLEIIRFAREIETHICYHPFMTTECDLSVGKYNVSFKNTTIPLTKDEVKQVNEAMYKRRWELKNKLDQKNLDTFLSPY